MILQFYQGALYRYKTNTLYPAEEPTELVDMRCRLQQAEDDRNRVIHSMWAATIEVGAITRIKDKAQAKRGLEHKIEDWTLEQLDGLADEINELIYDMLRFTIS